MSSPGYAVVDLETTGLSPGRQHRVVEIGVVLLDRDGVAVDEWCSLVNPQRDLGPQEIHGIRARDVLDAPTFSDLADDLAKLLTGRTVVAHNLGFDVRFLVAEYGRIGVEVPLGYERGLCTMSLADRYLTSPARSLAACCTSAGIEHTQQHSALHDARACAELLTRFLKATNRPEPWFERMITARSARWPALPPGCGRTCRRRPVHARPAPFLARLIDRLPRVENPPRANEYLALLDRALLDRQLSTTEQDALIDVARALRLSFPDVLELHRNYLSALAVAAWQDGVVTDEERQDLRDVADLLGLTNDDVDIVVRDAEKNIDENPWARFRLRAGDLVVFTGQMSGERTEWEARATGHGLRVTGNGVTKSTRLLVAADPDTLSGKADKARRYGIPIVTARTFETLLEQM
jgi:DNA polymerase-3 subunit epsilon